MEIFIHIRSVMIIVLAFLFFILGLFCMPSGDDKHGHVNSNRHFLILSIVSFAFGITLLCLALFGLPKNGYGGLLGKYTTERETVTCKVVNFDEDEYEVTLDVPKVGETKIALEPDTYRICKDKDTVTVEKSVLYRVSRKTGEKTYFEKVGYFIIR